MGPVYKFKQPFSFYLSLTDSLFADYQGFTDFLIRFPLFSANRQCQELKEKSDRKETTEEFPPICRGFARCFDLFHRAATYVNAARVIHSLGVASCDVLILDQKRCILDLRPIYTQSLRPH